MFHWDIDAWAKKLRNDLKRTSDPRLAFMTAEEEERRYQLMRKQYAPRGQLI